MFAAALLSTLTMAAPHPDSSSNDAGYYHGGENGYASLFDGIDPTTASPPMAQLAGYALRKKVMLQQQVLPNKAASQRKANLNANTTTSKKKQYGDLGRVEESPVLFRMVIESAYPKDASLEQWKLNRSKLVIEYGSRQYRENVRKFLLEEANSRHGDRQRGEGELDAFTARRDEFLEQDF
ncbi:hypothetical protein CBS101457_002527 [Exobasidium rhododendri]|nr:hypothetical protein CBS101457_002527 [Exobasidium rhododendri]